jgi:hypothetical protein
MKVDLDGRVKNLDLPVSKPLLPLLEAITNSLHAIDDACIESGIIKIRILREKDESAMDYGDESRALDPIIGFRIEDNGVGFNDKNFVSFETCDSRHKVSRGAKGIGRLLWLKAFGTINIRSCFTDDTTMWIREFGFSLPDGVIKPKKIEGRHGEIPGTVIQLGEFLPDFAKNCPKKAGTIADYLINHLILNFLNPNAPTIDLLDDAEQEPINLNSRFKERFQVTDRCEKIQVGEHTFELHHFHLITPEPEKNRLQLVASYREVLEIRLGDRFPGLKSKLLDGDNGAFVYLGILTGDLLDLKVNQNRTGFDLAGAGELTVNGEPTQPEIEDEATDAILAKLDPYLQNIRKATTTLVREFVQQDRPEYRPLMPQIQKQIDRFSPNASPREIIRRINEIQLDEELDTLDEAKKLKVSGVEAQLDYRVRYQAFLERVTRESETRLAQYVTHRRAILDLLEERLKRRDDEKYPLEEEIHELIFPVKATSDDPGIWGHQNLWLVDERLAYHFWLASDKPLKTQEVIDSDSEERPDMVIMNRPGAFSPSDEENSILSSVTIVELKRPGRSSKGSDKKNPIEQIFGYVDLIREGKVKNNEGRAIRVGETTAFFAYLVCDINKGSEFEKMTKSYNLEPTPDGLGYFTFNKPLNTYIEVITFEKLVRDARQRNRVLFKKMGIDEKLLKAEMINAESIASTSAIEKMGENATSQLPH